MEDHQEHAKEQAIKNMKAGVITGMVVFGIGLGRYLISKFGNVNLTGYEDIGVDWYLIDLGILFLMIWGLTRYSRMAAVALFLYFLISKVMQLMSGHVNLVGVAIGLLMLFFFAVAVQGAFAYHRLLKSIDADYKPTKTWVWWLATPVVLILGFLMTLGLVSELEITPATYVKTHADLTVKEREALVDMHLIDEQTNVKYFYSYGLFSFRDGGVLMTDQELIIFAEHEGEIYYDNMRFEDMDWVKRLRTGGDLEDSLFQVAGKEQYQGFQFELSVEGNMDTVFFQDLKNRINPPPPKEPIPMPDY